METDRLAEHSLVLVKDGKILHYSDMHGLRPLVECVMNFKGKVSGCILHDKVIGLAAAKIIAYSGMIGSVKTKMISEPAKKFLDEKGIPFEAENLVENILNLDKSMTCPMETKALAIDDPEEFFLELKRIMKI